MGKLLTNPMEKITQRSIGFRLRQILFFAEYPEFKPDEFCRNAIDNQIEKIDERYNEKTTE